MDRMGAIGMAAETELDALHAKRWHNRQLLAEAAICGCFYCFKEFAFDQIVEWVDEGRTALCPDCGIDAVLGFDTEKTNQDLLHRMREYWFKRAIRLTPEEWKTAVGT